MSPRLLIATASGVGTAALTALLPVETLRGALVLGGVLLVLGLGALIAGVVRHRRGSRASHRSHLPSGHVVRAQGVAFLLWFSGHAVLWAGALSLAAGAVLGFFGPRGGVLVATAGLTAAAVFSVAGLAGRGPMAMLGLCWEHRVCPSTVPAAAYPELALALWPRFRDASERDARRARDTQRMPVLTRIQIALDLARSGRAGPRLDLGGRLQASVARESACRLRALALTAWPAMVLVALLLLLGLLGLPPSFDPKAWPSIASLSSATDSREDEETGEVEPSPTQPHDSPDDEASIEPSSDALRHDSSDPPEADHGDPGEPSPGEGERGGEEPQGDDGAQEGSQPAQQGSGTEGGETDSTQAGEGEQGEGNQGEGEQGEGEQGEGEQGEGEQGEGEQGEGEQASSAVGASPDPGSGDSGQAGAGSPGAAPASRSAALAGSPSTGEQGGESGASQPQQASAGAGAGPKPPEADPDSEGSGSGQGDSEAEGTWGLGSRSPLGEPTALKPPAPSDVLTLYLPVLGSQTVRLEDEPSDAFGDADAPRASGGRRGSATPAPERTESEPSPPQQPLPAWIVRLLRGKVSPPQSPQGDKGQGL